MNRTLILVIVVALCLVGLFFALRPAPTTAGVQEHAFDLEIQDSTMIPSEVSVVEGDRVTLEVSAARPIEIHLHGYDLEEEVEPGEPATLSFEATLTGRFALEDHSSQADLGTLIVEPRQGS